MDELSGNESVSVVPLFFRQSINRTTCWTRAEYGERHLEAVGSMKFRNVPNLGSGSRRHSEQYLTLNKCHKVHENQLTVEDRISVLGFKQVRAMRAAETSSGALIKIQQPRINFLVLGESDYIGRC